MPIYKTTLTTADATFTAAFDTAQDEAGKPGFTLTVSRGSHVSTLTSHSTLEYQRDDATKRMTGAMFADYADAICMSDVLLFTSGTTPPKPVMLSYDALAGMCQKLIDQKEADEKPKADYPRGVWLIESATDTSQSVFTQAEFITECQTGRFAKCRCMYHGTILDPTKPSQFNYSYGRKVAHTFPTRWAPNDFVVWVD